MLQRFGAVSGLIAIGLLVWSFSVFSGPTSWPEDPDSVVLRDLIEAGSDADGAAVFAMFAIPFLVVFGGYVADRFRRHGLPSWVGSTFLLGTVLLGVAMMLIGGVGQMASTLQGIPGAESIARFIVVFSWSSTTLFTPAIFAVGAMAVIATMEAGALPKTLGYSAGVVALSSLTPWVGVLVLGLWIAIASLVLTIEKPAMAEHSMAGV
ncbi:MAG: hypothetical protein WEA76_10755 [Acidimicrobiia bacterium]